MNIRYYWTLNNEFVVGKKIAEYKAEVVYSDNPDLPVGKTLDLDPGEWKSSWFIISTSTKQLLIIKKFS